MCICMWRRVTLQTSHYTPFYTSRERTSLYKYSIQSRYTYLPTFTHTHLVFKSSTVHTFHPARATLFYMWAIFSFQKKHFYSSRIFGKHFFAICYFVRCVYCTTCGCIAIMAHLSTAYEEFGNQCVEAQPNSIATCEINISLSGCCYSI